MTLQELITDLKAAGANGNTLLLAMNCYELGQKDERGACASIEYDLAKSPAMFATMAEYKAYKNGVQEYRTRIIARGEA